jgi:hypothetical protein
MIVAVCLTVIVAAVAYAAGKAKAVPVPEVVRARRFELVDAKGKVLAALTADSDGSSMLHLYSRGSKNSVSLTCTRVGSSIDLGQPRGRASLTTSASGQCTLSLGDGSESADLFAGGSSSPGPLLNLSGGAPAVSLDGPDGGLVVIGAGSAAEGSFLVLNSAKSRGKAGLWAGGENGTALRLYDGDAMLRGALGVTSLETPKTGETLQTSESSLVLFDKEGKVMWQAP